MADAKDKIEQNLKRMHKFQILLDLHKIDHFANLYCLLDPFFCGAKGNVFC